MSATESAQPQDRNDSGFAAKDPPKRRRALAIVTTVFILAALAWFLLWFFVFSTRESTDNAYVGGNLVGISAQVPGTVVAVLADNTEHVDAGQVLVRLDPTDADVRLRQARSALALAVRQVRGQTDSASGADSDSATMSKAKKGGAAYSSSSSSSDSDSMSKAVQAPQLVSWFNSGDDQYIADEISKGMVGEGAITNMPLDVQARLGLAQKRGK